METALLRCRPRTPETPAASRPRSKRSQQNQYLVPGYLWRVSNLKLLAVAVQRMKSAHLQDVSPLFLPLGLNGTECPKLEKAQPAELETAVLWQGAFLAGRHWPRVLWICLQNSVPFCDGVAERTKPYSLKNHLHKPNPDSEFSLLECLQTFYYSHCSSPHCVTGTVSLPFKLSTMGNHWRNTPQGVGPEHQ